LKVINRSSEQIIDVEETHFVAVLSKQGWDKLVLPTSVQEYIDAGGYVPPVKPRRKPKPKRKTVK
tara:strand:- start:1176 stop:1370 length:195 start_codon:yes stop_codon:yes gene_type:complete